MFRSAPRFDGHKCKVMLKMLTNRFKLLEAKKLNLKKQAQRSVASLLREGKSESARIQVEHIIREDFTIEVYEILRQHVDLLLARFAVVQNEAEPRKEVQESVCTIIYAGWLLGGEIAELKVLYEQLATKYGKPFVDEVTKNSGLYINPRVLRKLQYDIPEPALVETYLIEIARAHRVDWQPVQPVGAGAAVPAPIDVNELEALRAEHAAPAPALTAAVAEPPVAAAAAMSGAPAHVEAAPVAAGAQRLGVAQPPVGIVLGIVVDGRIVPAEGAPAPAPSAPLAPAASPPAPAPAPPSMGAPMAAAMGGPVVQPSPPPPSAATKPAPVLPVASPQPPPAKPANGDDELARRLAALKAR